MQRYPATSLGGGVSNNNTVGPSSRESSRVDSSFSATNYPLNSRRPSPLVPYKIKCDKEPFNSRFGPPDFYPQTPNCPEETLTKEYLQSGYKETVEGIEEAKEVVLTGANYFVKSEIILKCKEAVRKRLRLINDLRAQKRKAGQVYGVPLSGPLLVKPGVFPEQRPCVEDFRRKWIEALSQQHKRLRSLADHVPHGYRKKSLFEVLIRYNVPLLRATWFIKINYLNQARPTSTDKAQATRTELWTKDVIEYLTQLLDEIIIKDGQSTSALLTPQRLDAASALHDTEEPSLQFKWQYMVQLLNWHYAEGLLLSSLIIEWALNQLQEKESAEAFELLLPVVSEIIESLSLSQTFVRTFVELAIRFIHDNCPDCSTEDPNIPSLTSTLIEMVYHLILTVPDSFVALDCSQLIPCIFPDISYKHTLQMKLEEISNNSEDKFLRHKSLKFMFSSIYKRASDLGKIVNPSIQGHGAAKVIKYLDKALLTGDLRPAYVSLFEDLSDVGMEEKWIAEVSPFLRSSLKWFGSVNLSLVCSIFFLCEWATCNYRDHHSALPQNVKFSGGKHIAPVYMSVLFLKLKREDLRHSLDFRSARNASETSICLHDSIFSQTEPESSLDDKKNKVDIFRSPGPLHDIIVCWLDQHETGEELGSFKRVQFLLMELIRNGIFYPQAYLRQLIVSGIMDRNEAPFDLVRRARHYRILSQLPGSCMLDILKEAQIAEFGIVCEASRVYSNERRFVLQGRSLAKSSISKNIIGSVVQKPKDKDGNSSATIMSNSSVKPSTSNHSRARKQVVELKRLISSMLHLPYSCETISGEFSASLKKNRLDVLESTPGCDDFKRVKRQKIGDGRSSSYQATSSSLLDDNDSWLVSKGIKVPDSIKVDPPQKMTKTASRNRQKGVRKTSSLAQLAAARVESSQGASTSHVCDNNINCSHHRSNDNEVGIANDLKDKVSFNDIGKSLKQLRLLEKRSISIWLLTSIKQLIERNDKSSGAFSVPVKDKIAGQWKLGEDELSFILYILDCCDLVSAVRLILWLLQKIAWRNTMLPKNRVVQTLQVGEAFLLSAIQRYEDIVVATDLLPETLSALVQRNVSMAQSNEKTIISASFIYAQKLLKEYRDIPSVVKWEKKFRPSCDQRLLAELDSRRAVDGELGTACSDDFDEYRQKMSGRVSRTGIIMKDLIKRLVEDSAHYFYGKEKKVQVPLAPKSSSERINDAYHVAQDIVQGLADYIRQNREADGDLSVVASAVSAIVNSVGSAIINFLDATTPSSYTCAQHILRIHVNSLCLLKDFLGESYSRIIDLALAAEASSAVSVAFVSGKTHRSSFQPSPESNDTYMNHSDSTKIFAGKAAKTAAAVSALVIGAVVHGVISLERMITVLKLREGLDVIQFIRSKRTSSNGTSRNNFKIELSVEIYVHWFRLLVGNCRTIFDGLVSEIVGETYVTSLSKMQRRLPLSMVFSPAYSIFSMVIWRPYIFSNNMVTREDILLYHSLCSAICDILKHHPFRDLCLRDTHAFYDHLSSDVSDSEFAAMLELHSPDKHLKTMAFVPLRSRMFLNAIIDCKMPPYTLPQEDGSFAAVPIQMRENDGKLQDKIVHIFDSIQPAKFHWQWVELRLLLDEQALVEKIETKESFVEAIRSLSPNAENFAISESEKFLSQIVLTRILVRPDAASLYAEIAHLLGKSLEESLVMDIKWILAGGDVLSGRKSIKQQLMSVAQRNSLSTKARFWKPWGWSNSNQEIGKLDRKKLVHVSIEEGEVIDEPISTKKCSKKNPSSTSHDSDPFSHQYVTEKALADLIFPCLDRCSTDLRNSLTAELIKQMSTIDLQINFLARVSNKQSSATASGIEVSISKSNSRKGSRGGSPGMGRRQAAAVDLSPPSVVALKSSMWLRLHFLVRLLPIVYADREPSPRNMRHTLASIILRLLGTRFIYDDTEFSLSMKAESSTENSTAASSENYHDSLFDMLLSVLHALLSSWKPNWLKSNSSSKSNAKSSKDFPAFDREVLESLQNELDRMELPASIRRRIQSAMPILPTPLPSILSCHPPSLPSNIFTTPQPALSTPNSNIIPRLPPSSRVSNNSSSKSKTIASLDSDMEIDPWTLLEEGTVPAAAASASNNNANMSGDHSHLKACSWLKGAVRVRRADLTYVGALDDNS